ncbi:phage portal protein [Paraburkholderia azotifigens]|uniref:phage portal protein n=1 Tax=Paraburkholderia azotifigens TaxID=2057004 RepID=UPI00316B7133
MNTPATTSKPRKTLDRRYVGKSVYDAALDRMRLLYARFDRIVVSFSGGKDSTVVLQLALQVARETGRLPLEAHFYDEECISPDIELQAATVAAIFSTFVTSPYDPALVQDALGAGEGEELPLYQALRAQWANDRPAYLNGVRIPTLAPGETLDSVSPAHPDGNFEAFAHEMQRVIAAALGLSAEQVTQDWSKTNYSSARAALLEAWKTLQRRRDEFCLNFASPFYGAWLWEAMERGELPLPARALPYIEARAAYSRCSWTGVARGWIDPTKERAGAVMGMDAALSTLKRECAEQGLDYEEVLHQRAAEIRLMKELGLDLPDWTGAVAAATIASPPEMPAAQ